LTNIFRLFENEVTNNTKHPVSDKYDDTAHFNTSHVNGVYLYKSNKTLNRNFFHNQNNAKGVTMHFDINNEVPENQKYQLRNLLESYNDCFALSPVDLGSIDIGDVPTRQIQMILLVYRLIDYQ